MTLAQKIEAQRAEKAAKQARLDAIHAEAAAEMTGPILFDGIVDASGQVLKDFTKLPTISEIKSANQAAGGHFFDRAVMNQFGDTMRTLKVFREEGRIMVKSTVTKAVYTFQNGGRIEYARHDEVAA